MLLLVECFADKAMTEKQRSENFTGRYTIYTQGVCPACKFLTKVFFSKKEKTCVRKFMRTQADVFTLYSENGTLFQRRCLR